METQEINRCQSHDSRVVLRSARRGGRESISKAGSSAVCRGAELEREEIHEAYFHHGLQWGKVKSPVLQRRSIIRIRDSIALEQFRPDYTRPRHEQNKPDHDMTRTNQTRSDHNKPYRTVPYRTKKDHTVIPYHTGVDQTRLDHTGLDQFTPDYTGADQNRPDHTGLDQTRS